MTIYYILPPLAPIPNTSWFSSETLVLYKSFTYLLTVEPIHLLSEVKCNGYFAKYSKFSTRNYSIAYVTYRLTAMTGINCGPQHLLSH